MRQAARCGCIAVWFPPLGLYHRVRNLNYGGVHDDSGNTGRSAYKALLEGGNSEFNALPGGSRDSDGKYLRLDAHGFYWSATEGDTGGAWFFNFGKGSQSLYRHSDGDKSRACSVRCIKP